MKDDALNPSAVRLRQLPIAQPTDAVREQVMQAVGGLLSATAERRGSVQQLHDWLRTECGVEKPGEKLSSPEGLAFDAFVVEVKARRPGRGITSKELRRLHDEYDATVPSLQRELHRAADLERMVAVAVHEAYGLTAEDAALLWRTAPPRMPVPPAI